MTRFLQSTKQHLDMQLKCNIRLRPSIDLISILAHLSAEDKEYLHDQYMQADWHEGSRHVFDILQGADILSISDYVHHRCFRKLQDAQNTSAKAHLSSLQLVLTDEDRQHDQMAGNAEDVEHIMNDLLDGNYDLIRDLLRHLNCTHPKSLKLTELLDHALQRLVHDLRTYPDLKHRNYFGHLEGSDTPSWQLLAFRSLHIKHILQLESHTIHEALSSQSEWSSAPEALPISEAMRSIMSTAIGPASPDSCERLLALAQVPGFCGWRWWLQLWRALLGVAMQADRFAPIATAVRRHLKLQFAQFQRTRNERIFVQMLLIVRQTAAACCPRSKDFCTYSDWFGRQLFGEMGYVRTADEFRLTIETMSRLVQFERDVSGVLEVHLARNVAPPSRCGELVREFKKVTRARLDELTRESEGEFQMDVDDVQIVVSQ